MPSIQWHQLTPFTLIYLFQLKLNNIKIVCIKLNFVCHTPLMNYCIEHWMIIIIYILDNNQCYLKLYPFTSFIVVSYFSFEIKQSIILLFTYSLRHRIPSLCYITGIGRAIALALVASGAETFVLSKTQQNLDTLVAEVLQNKE